ncbi:hypothetical protein C8F01DRAFT_1080330 [Mycena amicta]|nr:hypothetical protein C8F01DRAFT_1080330 [Mycena amicta]
MCRRLSWNHTSMNLGIRGHSPAIWDYDRRHAIRFPWEPKLPLRPPRGIVFTVAQQIASAWTPISGPLTSSASVSLPSQTCKLSLHELKSISANDKRRPSKADDSHAILTTYAISATLRDRSGHRECLLAPISRHQLPRWQQLSWTRVSDGTEPETLKASSTRSLGDFLRSWWHTKPKDPKFGTALVIWGQLAESVGGRAPENLINAVQGCVKGALLAGRRLRDPGAQHELLWSFLHLSQSSLGFICHQSVVDIRIGYTLGAMLTVVSCECTGKPISHASFRASKPIVKTSYADLNYSQHRWIRGVGPRLEKMKSMLAIRAALPRRVFGSRHHPSRGSGRTIAGDVCRNRVGMRPNSRKMVPQFGLDSLFPNLVAVTCRSFNVLLLYSAAHETTASKQPAWSLGLVYSQSESGVVVRGCAWVYYSLCGWRWDRELWFRVGPLRKAQKRNERGGGQ